MIKYIIFDLGEVYLNGLLGAERFLEKELNMPKVKILSMLKCKDLNDLFLGKISEDKYFKRVMEKNKLKININKFKRCIRRNFNEIKGVKKIILKLRKNYKLGLLSTHAKEWIDYCNKKFNFYSLFDQKTFSYEIKVAKPNRKAYLYIIKKFKTIPKCCLFIDDQEKNLKAAGILGMKTILFKNAKQLKYNLRRLNLII